MVDRERRTEQRITPGRTIKTKVRAFVPARVVDISINGVQIELPQSLPPRTACDLRFQTDEGEIMVKATVRSCRVWAPGRDEKNEKILLYRAGLEFDEAGREKVSEKSRLLFGPGVPERTGKVTAKDGGEGGSSSIKDNGIEITFDE